MFLALVLGALAAAPVQQDIDTTVSVERSQRLTVNAFGGDIVVRPWNRNAVRVQATESRRARVEVASTPTAVRVRTVGRHGPAAAVDLTVTAPAWMSLSLSGVHTAMTVEGIQSSITIETVDGDIHVRGGDGNVTLQSVQGAVSLRDAKGRIAAESVNDDVHLINVTGEVAAETVNGDVLLDRVNASSVQASTVNGDITYDGPLQSAGRYQFSTHNGDITIATAAGTNADVTVSTFRGELESDFPLPIRDSGDTERYQFTLGTGGAQVELESFQGTIRLARPGAAPRRPDSD